jgi:hypothetical protein
MKVKVQMKEVKDDKPFAVSYLGEEIGYVCVYIYIYISTYIHNILVCMYDLLTYFMPFAIAMGRSYLTCT